MYTSRMKIKTHADIIGLWPNIDDLSKDLGKKFNTVNSWSGRNQIPSIFWPQLIKAGKKRNIELTPKILMDTQRK